MESSDPRAHSARAALGRAPGAAPIERTRPAPARRPHRAALLAPFALVLLMALPGAAALGALPGAPGATALGPLHAPTASFAPSTGHAPLTPSPSIAATSTNRAIGPPGDAARSNQYRLPTAAQLALIDRSAGQPGYFIPPATPARAGPVPAAPSRLVAVTGTVETAAGQHKPIAGATVTAIPLGVACQNQSCPPVQTDSSGRFTAWAWPGSDEIQVEVDYYVGNYTVLTNLSAGTTVDIGVIYLVEDAAVVGRLVADDAARTPIPGARIDGQSRDAKLLGIPYTFSDLRGAFNVTVPPGASQIEIQPPGPYYSETIFVDLSPGQTYALGDVLVPFGARITVDPYDAVTRQPINGVLAGNDPAMWALEANNPATGRSFPLGASAAIGEKAVTFAPVGVDAITVRATGYLVNTSTIVVAPVAPGSTEDLGRVYLEPATLISLTAGLTFSPAAFAAENVWGVGNYYVDDCSLDGYLYSIPITNPATGSVNMTSNWCSSSQGNTPGYCQGPNTVATVLAAPLRNWVHVLPDVIAACSIIPTWPIPGDTPVVDNWTYVNVTADRPLDLGYLNLTPGTYLSASVLPGGHQPYVQACSTDVTGLCLPGVSEGDPAQRPVAYCPMDGITVCIPAPPGNVQLSVEAPGCVSNQSEAFVPPGVWTETPLPLADASLNHVAAIHLTCDSVVGSVRDARTGGVPPGLVSIDIKPAGSAPYPQTDCVAAQGTGDYGCGAAPGWDVITASSPDYLVNRTWVYVGGSSVAAPTINLTPETLVEGKVVGPNGFPLNDSSTELCPVTDTSGAGCAPVLGGLPNTNGSFWQYVAAGHIPLGQYRVFAGAPGYFSNQSWINVSTAGCQVSAGTIVLEPLVDGPAAATPWASRGGPVPASTPGSMGAAQVEWVVGEVVDNATGAALPGATIAITSALTGAQTSVSNGIDSMGTFDFPQADGGYWFNFTVPGFYATVSLFADLNGSSSIYSLGTVRMDSLPYLHGRVVIDPWRSVVSVGGHLGPAASVEVCNHDGTVCGAPGRTDTAGYFNVSAPLGIFDLIRVTALGSGPGTVLAGFLGNRSYANVTTNGSGPMPVVGLIIFAEYSGEARDGSRGNASPLRWGSVGLLSVSHRAGAISEHEMLNGNGQYTAYLPPGNITEAVVTGRSYTVQQVELQFNLTEPALQNFTDSRDNLLPNTSVEHFGWLQFEVVNAPARSAGPSAPAPFASVSTELITANASVTYTTSGTADSSGFVNVSAPIGPNVTLLVAGPDDNPTTITNISVNASATTFVNGTGTQALGTLTVVPWGWLAGVVWDPAAPSGGAGVDRAGLTVLNAAGDTGAPGVVTNALGQFLTDAPIGNPDLLAATAAGYLPNTTSISTQPGRTTLVPSLELRGDGIVGGRVYVAPGMTPVYGATVQLCPTGNPACTDSNATTNGSGDFWVTGAPGLDVLNVTLPGYSVNGTPLELNVAADSWNWTGAFVLFPDALVLGTVLGNPTGQPLARANVSACSTLALSGEPTGPCFGTVGADANGRFELQLPAGAYILNFTDPGYNTTYLPVDLRSGEVVNLGVVFLDEDGSVAGVVFDQSTDTPIGAAQVLGCELWSAGNCTESALTGSNGAYILRGPPGGYQLAISAPGFEVGYARVTIDCGLMVEVAPVYLEPMSSNQAYTVSGTVVDNSTGAAVPGGVVEAGSGFAGAIGPSGQYVLTLPWGAYRLTASTPGYAPGSRAMIVHANTSGVDFALAPASFTVSGTVRDGLDGAPLSAIGVYAHGVLLGTTAADGGFRIVVGPGAYRFVAAPISGATSLAPSAFEVVVTGSDVGRDVELFPAIAEGRGAVVNALTGGPIAGASIAIEGRTADGIPSAASYTTGATGDFDAPLYLGTYALVASAPGFRSEQVVVGPADNRSFAITMALTPISTVANAPLTSLGLAPVLLLAGLGIAGAATYVLLGRWRTAPPFPEPVRFRRRPAGPLEGGDLRPARVADGDIGEM